MSLYTLGDLRSSDGSCSGGSMTGDDGVGGEGGGSMAV